MAASENEQTETVPAPIELLGGEPWTSAFFTTYALSLTFFEAVVLRELRRVGCEEIWIFVDADGYRTSLAERRAFRVGQEYRVIPIAMPKGVFHPKCTFLASAKTELLLVGSGNITFGGFGRNLEVMDVIYPRTDPGMTRQFAAFVDALAGRLDLEIADRAGLRKLAQLAKGAAGEEASDAGSARLLHSCEKPILEGIRDAVQGLGSCKRLTVLSPYFDSTGGAVKALAEAIGAEEIAIGLAPGSPGACTFPFSLARSWERRLSAATPDLAGETRTLHAKWFEAEFQRGVVTLTGSVNATWPALCTTDNIEVGVLRISKRSGTWVRWAKAPIPKTPVVEAEREERVRRPVLYAQLDAGGCIQGQLLAAVDVAGQWEAMLGDAGDESQVFGVAVSESGAFTADVPNCERFAFASALQLNLEKGGTTVRGWVHQEDILRMPRLRRLGVTSLLRLINRQETEDDDIALLDYLSLSANKHLGLFSQRISHSGGGNRPRAGAEDAVHNVSNIAPSGSGGFDAPRHSLSESAEAVLERVFARLRQRIVHRDPGQEPPSGPTETEEDEADEKNKDRRRRRAPPTPLLVPALERFEKAILREIERANEEGKEDERRALFVVWFEVKEHMLLSRLNRRDLAFEFAKAWLALAGGSVQTQSPPGPLEQYVFTCAALCSLLAPEDGRALLRSRMHEDLERYCGGAVNWALAADSVLSGEHVNFVALLIGSTNADLCAELDAILQTKTIRQQLEEAYAAYCAGSVVQKDLPVFQGSMGSRLYEAMRAKGPRQVQALRDRRAMCAFDFLAFKGADKRQLERGRIVQCINCKRFTIQLAP